MKKRQHKKMWAHAWGGNWNLQKLHTFIRMCSWGKDLPVLRKKKNDE